MGNDIKGRGVFLLDGSQELKTSLLWDEDTDAWKYYSNSPLAVVTGLYRTIPTLYRGIAIIENEVQNVPFTVFNKSGKEIDTTTDWQNVIGCMPNPRKVFGLTSQSLDRHGVAYMLKSSNRAKIAKDLKWLAPASITPIFDNNTGELLRFKRTLGASTIEIPPEDMLYFWLSDSDVENAPPESYPLRAALQAAGVLHHLDAFINAYFQHGAIRPTMIMAKGMPNPDERERIENWWTSFMTSLKNAFKVKVFNADTIEAKQIGDGLDQLQNQELTADQRQDVALALGVPQSILFANSANYATAQSDMRNFYNMTVIPRCEAIAEVLNDQLLKPMGYEIWPSPESLEIYQEDEAQRSAALGQMTGAGIPLLMAIDLLGYDLTDEQRAELEALAAQKEERAEEMTENMQGQPQAEQEPEPEEDDEETKAELKHWRRLCNRALRENHPMPCDFVPDHIPAARAAAIAGCLREAKTGADIKAAFEQETPIPLPSDWPIPPDLLAELKRANDLLESVTK